MPKARIKSNLPIEIVVRADERHHTSVRKPRTHAYRRASEAPVSARAVAVIRPVPIIIPLPLFLCTLSGKRQLHAYRYRSASQSGLPPNRRPATPRSLHRLRCDAQNTITPTDGPRSWRELGPCEIQSAVCITPMCSTLAGRRRNG